MTLAGILRGALECGGLLPLWHQPACWRGIVLSGEIPASKLAGRKAAASCRTPKLHEESRPTCPPDPHSRDVI